MEKHGGSESARSVLHPTTPPDIGERTQRQRIIDALIESCAEKTYTATTITDIVAGARISRTTFYKQFRDKRECFDAALVFCLEQLQEVAAGSHSPDDPPADAARKGATAVLEAIARRPGLAQLLAGDALSVDPIAIDRFRRGTVPALEALWARDGKPEAHLDPRLAFGQAQVLLLNHLSAGRPERIPDLLPEIVYLAVSPFGGHEEAMRQSRLARNSGDEDAGAGDR
jgi:AcrR family transcriptional regulator